AVAPGAFLGSRRVAVQRRSRRPGVSTPGCSDDVVSAQALRAALDPDEVLDELLEKRRVVLVDRGGAVRALLDPPVPQRGQDRLPQADDAAALEIRQIAQTVTGAEPFAQVGLTEAEVACRRDVHGDEASADVLEICLKTRRATVHFDSNIHRVPS